MDAPQVDIGVSSLISRVLNTLIPFEYKNTPPSTSFMRFTCTIYSSQLPVISKQHLDRWNCSTSIMPEFRLQARQDGDPCLEWPSSDHRRGAVLWPWPWWWWTIGGREEVNEDSYGCVMKPASRLFVLGKTEPISIIYFGLRIIADYIDIWLQINKFRPGNDSRTCTISNEGPPTNEFKSENFSHTLCNRCKRVHSRSTKTIGI